jgi:hypothetical protein
VKGHAAPRPTVDELLASRERMNRTSAEFLKIDLETALTFLAISRQAPDDERRDRNRSAAKKAYLTVVKLAKKINMDSEEQRVVTEGLRQLRSELKAVGIAV